MAKISISDLLRTLQEKPKKDGKSGTLPNTRETWERIGRQDSFSELGKSASELSEFLKEWISENPYNAIS